MSEKSSRARLALEAAVLQCIEAGVWPDTIREVVRDALEGKQPDTFVYDGTFELSFLRDDERVCAGKKPGTCEIIFGDPSMDPMVVAVGDTLRRDLAGRLLLHTGGEEFVGWALIHVAHADRLAVEICIGGDGTHAWGYPEVINDNSFSLVDPDRDPPQWRHEVTWKSVRRAIPIDKHEHGGAPFVTPCPTCPSSLRVRANS